MTKEEILTKFRKREWSMGNGQCDECYGLGLKFYPQRLSMSEIGHEEGCSIGLMIRECGGDVLFKSEQSKEITHKLVSNAEGILHVVSINDPRPDHAIKMWKDLSKEFTMKIEIPK